MISIYLYIYFIYTYMYIYIHLLYSQVGISKKYKISSPFTAKKVNSGTGVIRPRRSTLHKKRQVLL